MARLRFLCIDLISLIGPLARSRLFSAAGAEPTKHLRPLRLFSVSWLVSIASQREDRATNS